MEIVTRAEARERGLKHYFTGRPCKHGHITHRFVSTKVCSECNIENAFKHRNKNPEIHKQYKRQLYRNSPEKVRDAVNNRRNKDPIKSREKEMKYRHNKKLSKQFDHFMASLGAEDTPW